MELNTKQSSEENENMHLLEQDTDQLGSILPTEVWDMVIAKVYRRENLKNSSPFFRQLLACQRKLFLFQNLLALVISTVWNNQGHDHFPLKDILNCRQVCKLWNTAIDSLIGNIVFTADGTDLITRMIKSRINYEFYYDADFRKHNLFSFLDYFESSHAGQPETRNPFIYPKLSISTPNSNEFDDDHEEGLEDFTEKIYTLLLKYGFYVSDFTLEIDQQIMDLEIVTRLQNWLNLMPNLKNLTINDQTEYFDIERPGIPEFLQTSPLPSFKFLEYLDSHHLRAPLFNNLIQRNNRIKTLHANEGGEEYDIFTFPLQNLTTVKLKLSTDSLDIIDKLSSPNVQWQLTSLSISFGIVHNFLSWSEFFEVVQEKFSKTLISFSLELPDACSERGGKAWRNCENQLKLCLPNLEQVYLSTWMSISLDFLLPMKDHLRVIFVRARYILPEDNDETKKSVVQFYGFESGDKILDSNIWTIFTKLEKIGIRIGCSGVTWFTRENLVKRNN